MCLCVCGCVCVSGIYILLHTYLFALLGFGQSGPYAKRGGYDNIASAIGGLIHITGPEVSFLDLCFPINF